MFERHQTARQIGLNELSEPRFGGVNTASSGLLVYKDTWKLEERPGACVRSHRAAGEAEPGGELQGGGVLGLPLGADTVNPAV